MPDGGRDHGGVIGGRVGQRVQGEREALDGGDGDSVQPVDLNRNGSLG